MSPHHGPRIRKRSGDVEPYRERKLRSALRRVGLSPHDRDRIVHEVEQLLDGELSTAAIDKVVSRSLRHGPAPCGARWNLRRALAELGPSGFPFERFVAELFAASGYRTGVGVRLQGRFIQHEVDVVAERQGERILCECKLLTRRDGKVDAKTALYVYGRAVDLDALRARTRFRLVTNGRFTGDAMRFGEGMGLQLLGWDTPEGGGLRQLVEAVGVMPLTALVHLPPSAKARLLAAGHVLCRDLVSQPALLTTVGVQPAAARRVLDEAAAIMRCTKAR